MSRTAIPISSVIGFALVMLVLGLAALTRCGADEPADPDSFFPIIPPVIVSVDPGPPVTSSLTTVPTDSGGSS
ncbi:MAG: hypothetical protein ACT4NY_02225 [Pseudonocardiales bacterium]